MRQRYFRGVNAAEKPELWDRWQRGDGSLFAVHNAVSDVETKERKPDWGGRPNGYIVLTSGSAGLLFSNIGSTRLCHAL